MANGPPRSVSPGVGSRGVRTTRSMLMEPRTQMRAGPESGTGQVYRAGLLGRPGAGSPGHRDRDDGRGAEEDEDDAGETAGSAHERVEKRGGEEIPEEAGADEENRGM